MTASEQLVAGYLDRLYECGRSLSRTQVEDLMADVREHVEAALLAAGRDDEATVRTVLDRLGSPEDIIAAAVGEGVSDRQVLAGPADAAVPSSSWSWREIVSVILIVPGSFFAPVIGPLAGIAFAASSAIWDKRTKRFAYIFGGVGAALPLFLIALGVSLFLPFSSTASSGDVNVVQTPTISSESATPGAVISVPNVVGVKETVGTNRLLAAGFMVVATYVQSGPMAPGFITSMSPAPGSQVPAGGQVSITVVR